MCSVIAEQCSGSAMAFSDSYLALSVSGLGVEKNWEGTHLGQQTPSDHRDIRDQYDIMLRNKSCRGEGGRIGRVQSYGICLPK